MATYNSLVSRDASQDPLVPEPVAAQIIQELPKASHLLSHARKVTMSSLTTRQPVLSVLPQAYWVAGDTGMKQTSSQDWKNVVLTAEEMAVLVPIPNAYIDDAQVPVWDEVRPRIVEAFGYLLDAAGLFGVSAPATFSTDIYTGAVAAGNKVNVGTLADVGADVTELGVTLAKQGFTINGFALAPGFEWNLVGIRGANGQPVYTQNPDGNSLYGRACSELENGAMDPTKASVIGGDWSKAVVGLRQDITFSMHEDGIISDDSGAVVFNAMQQDSTILRAVFRVGFATANPVTRLQSDETKRYPFAVLSPIAELS